MKFATPAKCPHSSFSWRLWLPITLCAGLVVGCSQRYGIRILNQSTNSLCLVTLSWGGSEVLLPAVGTALADHTGVYGMPYPDMTFWPRTRMPTKDVVFSYLTWAGGVPLTNSVRIAIPRQVLEEVRHSRSNFMFVVNMDTSVTLGVSPDPSFSGPTSH